MNDKTFLKVLVIVLVICVLGTAAFMLYGLHLWQDISIVEMVANWK